MKEFTEDKEFKNTPRPITLDNEADLTLTETIEKVRDLAKEVKRGRDCPFGKLEESADRLLLVLNKLREMIK
jgi:hypothetical protein